MIDLVKAVVITEEPEESEAGGTVFRGTLACSARVLVTADQRRLFAAIEAQAAHRCREIIFEQLYGEVKRAIMPLRREVLSALPSEHVRVIADRFHELLDLLKRPEVPR